MQLAFAIDAQPVREIMRGDSRPAARRRHRRRPLPDGLQLDLLAWHTVERPRTYGDCIGRPRPCPWMGCRYNLALDVGDNGAISNGDARREVPADDTPAMRRRWRAFEREALNRWATMADTCALDVAARGWLDNAEMGRLLGLTRERVRQMSQVAMASALESMPTRDRDVVAELIGARR